MATGRHHGFVRGGGHGAGLDLGQPRDQGGRVLLPGVGGIRVPRRKGKDDGFAGLCPGCRACYLQPSRCDVLGMAARATRQRLGIGFRAQLPRLRTDLTVWRLWQAGMVKDGSLKLLLETIKFEVRTPRCLHVTLAPGVLIASGALSACPHCALTCAVCSGLQTGAASCA